MRHPAFLTVFLLAAGIFTLWCAIKNYQWLYTDKGLPGLFKNLIGQKLARWFYIIVGASILAWGLTRTVFPPRVIPTAFVFELAKPFEIDLTDPVTALHALTLQGDPINDLARDAAGWVSFWTLLPNSDPASADARDSTEAGPSFGEGFALRDKEVGGRRFGGREVFFNADLESCDNMLFSKRPLNSAVFAIVICSEEVSKANGASDGLMIYYLRAGSDIYKAVTGIDGGEDLVASGQRGKE